MENVKELLAVNKLSWYETRYIYKEDGTYKAIIIETIANTIEERIVSEKYALACIKNDEDRSYLLKNR